MNILITGAAGFIGSNLTKELLKEGHTIIGIDNFNDYYNPDYKIENVRSYFHNNSKIVKADITDTTSLHKIFSSYKFDKIIHLAASVGVRNSINNPKMYYKNNLEGTNVLLDFAKEYGVKDFIFASTSSVYGNNSPLPYSEDYSADRPISPYAMSKRAAELLCYTYHSLYKLNITILRFFTVYGQNGRPDMSPYIFAESILHHKQIEVYGDGEITRDFTNVRDIVRGITLSIHNPFPYEIFNLGSSSPISMRGFIKTLEDIIGVKANVKFTNKAKGDMNHTYANSTKAERMLGFKANINLRDGLAEFVEWFTAKRFYNSTNKNLIL